MNLLKKCTAEFIGALLPKLLCDALADTVGPTGDDNDLILKGTSKN